MIQLKSHNIINHIFTSMVAKISYVPKLSSNINFTPKFVKYSRIIVIVSMCSHTDIKRDKFSSILDAARRNLKYKENTTSDKNINNHHIFTAIALYLFHLCIQLKYLFHFKTLSLNDADFN